jgi:hypothetical protein
MSGNDKKYAWVFSAVEPYTVFHLSGKRSG